MSSASIRSLRTWRRSAGVAASVMRVAMCARRRLSLPDSSRVDTRSSTLGRSGEPAPAVVGLRAGRAALTRAARTPEDLRSGEGDLALRLAVLGLGAAAGLLRLGEDLRGGEAEAFRLA